MATMISAALIETGDIIRLVREHGTTATYRVVDVRQVRISDTRAELVLEACASGHRADASLMHSVVVERLESVGQRDLTEHLSYLVSGEEIKVTYYRQQFWW